MLGHGRVRAYTHSANPHGIGLLLAAGIGVLYDHYCSKVSTVSGLVFFVVQKHYGVVLSFLVVLSA